MNAGAIETEVVENAIALRDPSVAPSEQKQAITPAQAKIDAVAALTMKAYDRASQLVLTDAEIAALAAEFPDEAFLPGAAGKENLLYIQHACLRDRLNQVFRPGQWSIIPRNRWAEPFKTNAGKEASRVYVEAMLVIRGCFVAEAVGEMEYFPHNAGQNYGDAVEGAKTAALRRCCKELGIGLQAWRKDWCDGWWARKRKGTVTTPKWTNSKVAEAHKDASNVNVAPTRGIVATPEQRQRMIETIEKEGPDAVQRALGYFIEVGALLPTETLKDLPLNWVPATQGQFRELGLLIAELNDNGKAKKPLWVNPVIVAARQELATNPATSFNPEESEENPFNEAREAAETEPEQDTLPMDDEKWRVFPVPYGKHAGVPLGKLPKNTLWGFWKGHKVETEFKGKPIALDKIEIAKAFRSALDMAGTHYKFILINH